MTKRNGQPKKPKNYGIAVGRSKTKARKEGFDAAIAEVRKWAEENDESQVDDPHIAFLYEDWVKFLDSLSVEGKNGKE